MKQQLSDEYDYIRDKIDRQLIVITTGGTGGHIFPAEVVAHKLASIYHRHAFDNPTGERKYDILFIGDKRAGIFAESLPDIQRKKIHAEGVSGKESIEKYKAISKLGFGCLQVMAQFIRRKPSVIIGFGSYASLPVLCVARLMKIPYVLHEQNAVLGRTNRFALEHAARLAMSFTDTEHVEGYSEAEKVVTNEAGDEIEPEVQKIRYSGNPVRIGFEPTAYEASAGDAPFHLVITGGSQGAQFFGAVLPEALSALPDNLRKRLRVIQQVRGGQIKAVSEIYKKAGIDAALSPFLSDMPELLGKSHLFIGRAGASTIAELITVGRPSILIPLPTSADNHQHANAASMEARGACELIQESEANAKTLTAKIQHVMENPQSLQDQADKAALCNPGDPAEVVKNIVLELLEDVE